ncbi:MAG: hypothetical protein H7X89_08350, partial [Rhizobiales bacterium]|nr:hypothetical protein [Hyphomicrobiales bacterium]
MKSYFRYRKFNARPLMPIILSKAWFGFLSLLSLFTRSFARISLGGIALIIAWAVPAPSARADSPTLPPPPIVQLVDTNRVNILTGAIDFEGPKTSVGPAGQGVLSYDYFGNDQTGDVWLSTIKYKVLEAYYTVTLLGSSEEFEEVSGAFVPKLQTGGSLTHSGSTYTYTKSDGTVAVFHDVSLMCADWCTMGVADTITYPSGEKLTFTLRTRNNFIGIQSINSNLGYQIKVNYQCDSPSSADCYTAASEVIAINNAVDYCDPAANSCTGLSQSWPTLSISYPTSPAAIVVTDPVGNATTRSTTSSFTPSPTQTDKMQRPSSRNINYMRDVCFGCDPNAYKEVTDGSSSSPWTYSLYPNLANSIWTGTVVDPLGRKREVIAEFVSRRPLTDIVDLDGLHLETTYTWYTYASPTRVTFPEGNYTNYTYDSRGNTTE